MDTVHGEERLRLERTERAFKRLFVPATQFVLHPCGDPPVAGVGAQYSELVRLDDTLAVGCVGPTHIALPALVPAEAIRTAIRDLAELEYACETLVRGFLDLNDALAGIEGLTTQYSKIVGAEDAITAAEGSDLVEQCLGAALSALHCHAGMVRARIGDDTFEHLAGDLATREYGTQADLLRAEGAASEPERVISLLLPDGRQAEALFLPLKPPANGSLGWVAAVLPPGGRRLAYAMAAARATCVIGASMLSSLHHASARRREAEARLVWLDHLAHEARGPLSHLQLLAHQLATQTAADPRAQELVAELRAHLDWQDRLTHSLLDASRSERGALELHASPFDLVVAARAAVESMRLFAQYEDCELSLAAAGPPIYVTGDEVQLRSVIEILIDNALKHAHATNVRVEVEALPGRAIARVVDDGLGIQPEGQAMLFERYVSSSGVRGGTGLGLHVAKNVVALHGGALTVESQPGHGATFRVVLPTEDPDAPAPAAGRG